MGRLAFTSCEYRGGQLLRLMPDRVEPMYIAYTQQMHLEKAYPGLLPTLSEIESEHNKICDMIQRALSSTSVVPSKPSYERIIVDRIEASCRTLKRSQDAYLLENSIYLDTFIFRILFEIIPRRYTTLTLSIEPTSKSSIKQLLYEHGTVIGQGEYSLMVSLKEAREQLVRNDSLRARIGEYEELKGKLQNNPQYARLHRHGNAR